MLVTLITAISVGAGAPIEWERNLLTTNAAMWWAHVPADINGDGLLDLYVQENNSHGGPLLWYEAQDRGRTWTRHLIADRAPDGQSFAAGALVAADLDGDGDPDVLGLAHPGEWRDAEAPTSIYWYENPRPQGDPASDAWRAHKVGRAPAFVKDLCVADFDGNGRPDLAAITYRGNRFLVFLQSDAEQWAMAHESEVPNLHEGMDVGDLDGDGDPDLAANGYWFENPGTERTRPWTVHVIDPRWHNQTGDWSRNATKVACCDLDSDGRAEVCVAHSERAGYPIVLYRPEDPRAGRWVQHVIADDLLAVHTLQFADFDGDKRADLLVGVNASRARTLGATSFPVVIFFNPGGPPPWPATNVDNRGSYNARVGDVDGDGRPDIFRLTSHDATAMEILFNRPTSDRAVRVGPQPRDVFRDYVWTLATNDAGGALRVGGRYGYGGGRIEFPHSFDLDHAVRAELALEKLLCHDGTRGLAVSVNDQEWVMVPEPAGIPPPAWEYMHHAVLTVPIPLQWLRAGSGNYLRLRVRDEHSWNWPQSLIYGIHVRVYYDPARKPHAVGRLTSPRAGDRLGLRVRLQAEVVRAPVHVRAVHFLGDYEDVNLQGDGIYAQWQYTFRRGKMIHHIGSVHAAPWEVEWDTQWIPDQLRPFRLAAWIVDDTDLTVFIPPLDGMVLARDGISVELCRPVGVPPRWITRYGEAEQRFYVHGDLSRATAVQLVWSSWSPAYMNGLYVNGRLVIDREGPFYQPFIHRVPLVDLSVLKPGENVIRTGQSPRVDGRPVHGMEVNWPGVMVLIRYGSLPN